MCCCKTDSVSRTPYPAWVSGILDRISARQTPRRYVQYRVHTQGPPMDAITYTTARANLADTMNRVCDDHEPLIITRNGQQAVVMMSLEDFNALEETAYLLRSPKNARRLLDAMTELQEGRGKERRLAE